MSWATYFLVSVFRRAFKFELNKMITDSADKFELYLFKSFKQHLELLIKENLLCHWRT